VNLSHECVDLAQFYNTDIAASELYSELLDCKMLPTTVRSEILAKTPLELLTFIIQYLTVKTSSLTCGFRCKFCLLLQFQ